MSDFERPTDQFVRRLGRLAPPEPGQQHDRASLAALRRGLGARDGWDPNAAQVVYRLLPDLPTTWKNGNPKSPEALQAQEQPYFEVAALFALHPVVAPRTGRYGRPFTSALQALVQEEVRGGKQDKDVRAPLNRRVSALIDAHRDDVMVHLRHFVQRLDGTGIPVDWAQLIDDLDNWTRPDRRVQRRWARAWWNTPSWITPSVTGDSEAADAIGNE